MDKLSAIKTLHEQQEKPFIPLIMPEGEKLFSSRIDWQACSENRKHIKPKRETLQTEIAVLNTMEQLSKSIHKVQTAVTVKSMKSPGQGQKSGWKTFVWIRCISHFLVAFPPNFPLLWIVTCTDKWSQATSGRTKFRPKMRNQTFENELLSCDTSLVEQSS